MTIPDHQEVVDELQSRGFQDEFVDDYEYGQVKEAKEKFSDDAKTADVLDSLDVEGQVSDGLFEDPVNGPEYDFTNFFTVSKNLVGRMMYHMMAYTNFEYTYEDLVADIEHLANTAYYDAPFDKQKALEEKPENQKLQF